MKKTKNLVVESRWTGLSCNLGKNKETTPTFYDIRQTTTTLGQRKVNWFGESSRLLEFDRPLTEPGASKLTKVFLATRTAVWNQVSGAPRHRRDIADLTHWLIPTQAHG